MKYDDQLPITQHKRFVPYGTQPNPAFGEIFFMLGTLYEMPKLAIRKSRSA